MNKQLKPLFSTKPVLAALMLTFSPLAAWAAEPVTPDAGTILQQTQPVTPALPSSKDTGLSIEQEVKGELPSSAPFLVSKIQITGNSQFDTPTLHALVADAEGGNLTLSELNQLAARITKFYQSHGYLLARAVIPAQVIQDGSVDIQVIEASYGEISLDNHSRVSDALLDDTLSTLQTGHAVNQAEINRALLLASDIPGVGINATLKPGESLGSSDLLVEATPTPFITGNVMLDNYGNRYTGRTRAGFALNLVNPLHHGDILSLNGLTTGNDMNYGRIAYETLLNGNGIRVGGAYSVLSYELGDSLSSLDAHGTAHTGSLWVKHPFVRSRDANVYGQIRYDRLKLRDRIDVSDYRMDRHLDNGTISFSGDIWDRFLSGGVNTWNVAWTTGHVDFDDSTAQLVDAGSTKTQGSFSKINASLSRLQSLGQSSAVYLALLGQWANGNLDSSQKMIAGGPNSVRAYDVGAISGDDGVLATAEYRYNLGTALHGQWQATIFADSARVRVNKDTWASGTNHATLNGVGAGLDWIGNQQWRARAYVATPVGSTSSLVDSRKSVRGWVEISMGF